MKLSNLFPLLNSTVFTKSRNRAIWGYSVLSIVLFLLNISATAQSFTASDLSGTSLLHPTSLQFGPDGLLYVAEQKGEIEVYQVVRNGVNNYQVISTEVITVINDIQNHNDDGAVNGSAVKRQITGILVIGTAENPVLYVSSSDPREGGGGGGNDKGLDTNSGVISRLTKNGGVWEKVDLVRGLPRSEENHSVNGMQLDEINNILYVCSGGNTNGGAPSNNFAFTTEYALSTALLTVDLDSLDQMPVLIDPSSGASYVYDIPTLDDPSRANVNGISDPALPGYDGIDVGDPFGGNDGLNQAKLIENGPIQIFATGFRNIYDFVIAQNGRMYTWDNGPNEGWGGHPANDGVGTATNEWIPGEPGSNNQGPGGDAKVNNLDGLHLVTPGYYAGHPNPVRANPAGAGLFTHDHANGDGGENGVFRTFIDLTKPDSTLPADWPPVPLSLANPQEGDYQNPGVDDQSLFTIESSTNGLVEYTASNFGGALQGNLLAASFNGNLYSVKFNQFGILNSPSDVTVLAQGFGLTPLDVTAMGDNEAFPGTIWVANYSSNTISVFEPQDLAVCEGTDDNSIDEDGDGYTNADELDNGTDPCNQASKPKDFDKTLIGGFLVSDLNDPDDDDDGISDILDAFPLDAENGLTTNLPVEYPLRNGDPGFGFFGLGFTGIMSNGVDDYLSLIDDEDNSPTEIIAGGTAGLLTFNNVLDGDALNGINDQHNGYQFGINVNSATLPFTIRGDVVGPFFLGPGVPQDFQSMGIFMGTGDQDNYLKIVIEANGGNPGIGIYQETNGVSSSSVYPIAGIATEAAINLMLSVDPDATGNTAVVQPKYSVSGGPSIDLGSPINLSGPLLNQLRGPEALAVGIIATSRGTASVFNATWDNIYVTYNPNTELGSWVFIDDGPPSCNNFGTPGSCGQGRHEAAYVQVGDKFYSLGGRENNSNVNIYDPITDIWVKGSDAPFNIHHFQGVEYDGLIYIVGALTGGFPNEVPVDRIIIYDPQTDTWMDGPTIPASRRRGSTGVVVHNDKIYMVSGIQNGHTSGWVPWFDEFNPVTNTWTELPDAPRARDHFHAAIYNNKLYVAAGRRSGEIGTFDGTVAEVDVFDFTEGSWSTMPNNIPTERAGNTVAVLGNELIVIGGEKESGPAKNETEALDLNTGTWRALTPMNQGRHGTQAIVNNGGIYVMSGSPVQGGDRVRSQEAFFFDGQTTPIVSAINQSTLATSDNSLDLGTVEPNIQASTTVTLTNTVGNQGILIHDIVIEGDTDFGFSSTTGFPLLLRPGSSAIISVNVSSSTTGTKSGNLKISHSGTNAPETNIPLNALIQQNFFASYINAGGPAESTGGIDWVADINFSGGSTFSDNLEIANTTDDVIYQSERYGNFSYSIPVPNGDYDVSLHFAEIFYVDVSGGGGFGIGQRVFNVTAEGQPALSNFDINAEATGTTPEAIIKSFPVSVADGTLNILFQSVVGNPKLSAIAVVQNLSGPSDLTSSPTSYHFQGQEINTVSAPQVFTLSNSSTADVTISSVIIGGADASSFTTTLLDGTVVSASGNTPFEVNFAPTTANPAIKNAQITINHSGEGSPLVINLSGESIDPTACPAVGTPCDDGDPSTVNDVEDGNCNCAGTPVVSGPGIFINAGGPTQITSGVTWEADQLFNGGGTYSKSRNIANTEDDILYHTERNGNFQYSIPVTNGSYTVNLLFAEIFHVGSKFGIGKRVFDVDIEGLPVLTNFDINAENAPSNKATAVIKSFSVSVSDGTLDIQFSSVVNQAKISAIQIVSETPSDLSVNPSDHQFPSQDVSTTSGPQSFTVTNSSGSDVTINTVTLSGTDPGEFATTLTDGTVVSAGGNIGFDVTFSPTSVSPATKTAQLTINHSGAGSPLVINLSGEAVDPTACPAVGTPCDDGDPSTVNDVEDGNCNCAGTPVVSGPGIFINAGGPSQLTSGVTWEADQLFNGGGTYSKNRNIANTEDDILYHTERNGNFQYSIPVTNGSYTVNLLFAEIFYVGSKFGIGKRVFDVGIEGLPVLTNFDINAENAPSNKATAVIKSFSVSVSDGMLDIQFSSVVNQAKISAIQIVSETPSDLSVNPSGHQFPPQDVSTTSGPQSFTVTNSSGSDITINTVTLSGTDPGEFATTLTNGTIVSAGGNTGFDVTFSPTSLSPATKTAQLTINHSGAGSPLVINLSGEAVDPTACPAVGTPCDDGDPSTVNDVEDGNCNCAGTPVVSGPGVFINAGGPSQLTSGVTWEADQLFTGGGTYSRSRNIANTEDDILYHTERYGNFHYSIPLQNNSYTVSLLFAEIYYVGSRHGIGNRVFNVAIEGQELLTNFDINVETAPATSPTAVVKSFNIDLTDENLDIDFVSVVGNAKISAISIVPAGSPTARQATSLPAQDNDQGLSEELHGYKVFPNPGISYVTIQTSAADKVDKIHVINMLGQQMNTPFTRDRNGFVMDLTSVGSGYYFIILMGKDEILYRTKLAISKE